MKIFIEVPSADFVTGAAFNEPRRADFVIAAALDALRNAGKYKIWITLTALTCKFRSKYNT